MKKLIYILVLAVFSMPLSGQNVFNKIIYDTNGQLTSSVIALDTGYVVLTGTGTAEIQGVGTDIRCFSLTYLDLAGEKVWKRKYSDYQNQYWEGWNNGLKKNGNISYSTGGIVDLSTYNEYIYIYI